MSRGRFITLEGGEGAGKTTHLETLVEHLRARGRDVLSTREPGGTPLGERVRQLLLAGNGEILDPMAELLLVFAARAQHLARVIRPALEAGRWVVCDRFTDASYAYQGSGRGLGPEAVDRLVALVHPDFEPDLTLYLDLPHAQGLARARDRGAPDRFEQETAAFFDRVRQGYLDRACAAPARIRVVDASLGIEEVRDAVLAAADAFLTAEIGEQGA